MGFKLSSYERVEDWSNVPPGTEVLYPVGDVNQPIDTYCVGWFQEVITVEFDEIARIVTPRKNEIHRPAHMCLIGRYSRNQKYGIPE